MQNENVINRVTAMASDLAYKYKSPRSEIPYWKRSEKSTSQALVFIDENNENVVVAIPGTFLTHKADLALDARLGFGFNMSQEARFNRNKDLVAKLVSQYGKDHVTVTGHSLGGREALYIGKELDIPSVSYNLGTTPLDIVNNINKDIAKNPNAYKKATIFVNPFDLIATSSQLIPGATIKSTGVKNETEKMLYDIGLKAAVKKSLQPFSHLSAPGSGYLSGASGVAHIINKFLDLHSMEQFLPGKQNQTLKSSLLVTKQPSKSEYEIKSPVVRPVSVRKYEAVTQ